MKTNKRQSYRIFSNILALFLILGMCLPSSLTGVSAEGETDAEETQIEESAEQPEAVPETVTETPSAQETAVVTPTPSVEEAEAVTAAEPATSELEHTEVTTEGVSVTIKAEDGAFPEGTTVTITDASKEAAMQAGSSVIDASVVDAVAVDITFYHNGVPVEPADGHTVDVSITPKENIEGDAYTVVHILDNGEAEIVDNNSILSGDFAYFEADSFTIYAVIGTKNEMPPTRTYYFHDASGSLIESATQMVKDGDILYEPEIPEGSGDAPVFMGWFEDGKEEPFTEFGPVGTVEEDAEIHLKAVFSNKVSVFYKDLDGNIVFTQEATANGTITIDKNNPRINTGSVTEEQSGWTLTPGSSEDVSGQFKVGTENITLYPILSEGFWVTFNSNGGTVYSPQFIASSSASKKAVNPGTPILQGYIFTKWFSDPELTTEYDFSSEVTENITLYAGYEPGEASYLVRYWIEYQTSPEPERTPSYDEAKNTWTYSGPAGTWDYKMIARKSATGTTGADTEFDATLIFNEPYNRREAGYALNEEKTVVQKIKSDGTTVMDVYYDLVEFSLTFKFPSKQRPKILNDVTVKDTVKYTQNLGYLWDTIEKNYNKDGYEVLAENRRFVFDTAFVESREDLKTLEMPRDQVWSIGSRGKDNLFYRNWVETLDGVDPQGNLGVQNDSARARIETVKDDRTYYYYSSGSFYAGANGCVEISKEGLTGFTCRGDYSDGNYAVGKTSGTTRIWFHAHKPTADNWTYYNLYNRKTSVAEPELQYEAYAGRTFNFNVYYETDGYLDIYFFRNQYNLVFHENGGEELEDQLVYYEKNVSAYEPESYVENETRRKNSDGREFVFRGWYTDSSLTDDKKFDFSVTMPAYDINLYAKWEPVTYTVKFDSNGGSEVAAQTGIEYGQKAGRPEDPVREDYDFLGWTLEGNPYSFSSGVSKDITLVAKWSTSETYTVSYDLNGGTGSVPADDNKYGESSGAEVKDLPSGAKGPEGTPVFLGWVSDSDDEVYYPGSVVTIPDNNVVLSAKWGAVGTDTKYRLYFNLKPLFDECGVPYTYKGPEYREISAINNERLKLPADYRAPEGFSPKFRLEGWYRDEALTDGPVTSMQVDLKNEETENKLYAKWTRIYTITYDPNGGVWTDTRTGEIRKESYSVTQGNVRIAAAPVREGYTFVEWSGSTYQPGDIYAEKDPDKFYGDDTLVAVWKKNPESSDSKKENPPVIPLPDLTQYRTRVPNTSDHGLGGYLVGFLVSTVTAVLAAYTLKKWN